MKPVVVLLFLGTVVLLILASDHQYQDRHDRLLASCRKQNAYRMDVRSFCQTVIGPCGLRGTDQDCFVRLGLRPQDNEYRNPSP